jgi:hypothetical protein
MLPPQLLDEGLWSRKLRSTDELSVAEERLTNLNFEKEVATLLPIDFGATADWFWRTPWSHQVRRLPQREGK